MDKTNKRKKFKMDNKTITRIICLVLVAVTIFGFISTALMSIGS